MTSAPQAGNVVTGEMVEELILSGADIIKVGIGPGGFPRVCLCMVGGGGWATYCETTQVS